MAINDDGDILSAVHGLFVRPAMPVIVHAGDPAYPYAIAAALSHPETQILLSLRAKGKSYGPGMYSMPAGHLHHGESMTGGLLREMWEEVGAVPLYGGPPSPQRSGWSMPTPSFHKVAEMGQLLAHGDKVHCYEHTLLACTNWSGSPVNREPADCDDLCWFRLDQLPSNMLDISYELLLAAANGEKKILHGFDDKHVRQCFSAVSEADHLGLARWVSSVRKWADPKVETSYELKDCRFDGLDGVTRLPAAYDCTPVDHRATVRPFRWQQRSLNLKFA